MSRFQIEPTHIDEVVDASLSDVRTTASAHHNGLVKLPEDTLSSELTCWKCGRSMRLGRERLARAVEHVTKFGGRILLTNDDVKVANSTKDFDWRPHQRSRKS